MSYKEHQHMTKLASRGGLCAEDTHALSSTARSVSHNQLCPPTDPWSFGS